MRALYPMINKMSYVRITNDNARIASGRASERCAARARKRVLIIMHKRNCIIKRDILLRVTSSGKLCYCEYDTV